MKKILTLVVLIYSTLSWAWQPSSPIKVIVGQAPGGGNEVAIRGVIPIVEKNNPGVSFIVENHPGLNGVVGLNYFAEQKPDGQTILVNVAESSAITIPLLYQTQLHTDLEKYVPVTILAQAPLVIVVPITSSINTVPDLIAYLKNNKVNIGVSGSVDFLVSSYIIKNLHLSTSKTQVINYNSPVPLSIAVANNDVNVGVMSVQGAKSLLGTKIRAIAHTGAGTIPGLEDVPAIKQYVPGLDINLTWAVFLPPRTSPEIVAWYDKQFSQSLDTTQSKAYFYARSATVDVKHIGSQQLNSYNQLIKQRWSNLAKTVLTEKQ